MADYLSKFSGKDIDDILSDSKDKNKEVIKARGSFNDLSKRLLEVDHEISLLRAEIAKLNPQTLSTQIVERTYLSGNTINVGNHTEIRFTSGKATTAIDVNPVFTGNEFYSMVVLPVEFDITTTVKTFVRGNVKLVNKDLDITDFDVVHLTLYSDGFNVCCVVSGY